MNAYCRDTNAHAYVCIAHLLMYIFSCKCNVCACRSTHVGITSYRYIFLYTCINGHTYALNTYACIHALLVAVFKCAKYPRKEQTKDGI